MPNGIQGEARTTVVMTTLGKATSLPALLRGKNYNFLPWSSLQKREKIFEEQIFMRIEKKRQKKKLGQEKKNHMMTTSKELS